VTGINARMRHVFKECFTHLREQDIGSDGYLLKIDLADWKGRGNPVIDKRRRPVGVISQTDLVRRIHRVLITAAGRLAGIVTSMDLLRVVAGRKR